MLHYLYNTMHHDHIQERRQAFQAMEDAKDSPPARIRKLPLACGTTKTAVRFKFSGSRQPRTSTLRLRISLRACGGRLCVSNVL